MNLHLAVLGRSQRAALEKLGPIASAAGFYLAGGTALALRLGHRRSRDLDWFTPRTIAPTETLVQTIHASEPTFRTRQVSPGMLFGKLGHVETSFIEYKFRMLAKPRSASEVHCALASLHDLAAMKLLAVAQRGHKRDLVDVYALGTAGMPLAEMIECYQRKYRTRDILHLLNSLVFFGDADAQEMPILLRQIKWAEVKKALQAWVKALSRR